MNGIIEDLDGITAKDIYDEIELDSSRIDVENDGDIEIVSIHDESIAFYSVFNIK